MIELILIAGPEQCALTLRQAGIAGCDDGIRQESPVGFRIDGQLRKELAEFDANPVVPGRAR